VRGTVTGVHGDTVRRTGFSRLGPKPRLRAWAQLLILATTYPDRPWRVVTIGRGQGVPARSELTAPSAEQAAALLDELVTLYRHAMRQPLPLVANSSCAYAQARQHDKTANQALETARKKWGERFGDAADRHHRVVWGEAPDFGVLLAKPTTPVPAGPTVDDPTWFGALAQAVWQPLLTLEQLS